MDGVVVIDKPAGMTSHDVVDEVRRRFGMKKVGHGGTLDPDATGVLVVGLGRATRLLSYAQAAPKTYRALARFGITTTTQDGAGEILERRVVNVDADDIERELKRFRGSIQQVPPMVSAIRISGERLYRKARRGEEVDRPARAVVVYAFDLLDYVPDRDEADFVVRCSGGTYVRTLLHDLGEALGCGGHLMSLRRVEAGGFTQEQAVSIDDLDDNHLRPLLDAVGDMARLGVDADQARLVSNGNKLDVTADLPEGAPIALVRNERLLAIYKRRGDQLVPDRVIAQ